MASPLGCCSGLPVGTGPSAGALLSVAVSAGSAITTNPGSDGSSACVTSLCVSPVVWSTAPAFSDTAATSTPCSWLDVLCYFRCFCLLTHYSK